MSGPAALRPEKPAPILHVGITGHRWNKLAEPQAARIERQLREVFAAIDAATASAARQGAAFFDAATPTVRLLSGLAEGADQMAVRCRPQGWELCAILPFAAQRYRDDFAPLHTGDGADRRAEFDAALAESRRVLELPDTADSAQAYVEAGLLMVRQCDLLVAIWDGAPKAGPGGTEAVVSAALERNVPVVWISSGDDTPLRIISRPGEQGAEPPIAVDAIGPLVRGALLPPSGPGELAAVDTFFRESWRAWTGWVAFDWLKRFPRVWTWRWPLRLRSPAEHEAEWRAFDAMATMPGVGNAAAVERRAAIADSLATYFAHAYRGAYISTYLLSVLALAIALVDILPVGPSEASGARLPFRAALGATELALVVAVIAMVAYGRRARWHRRWLDYRALAERLRHLRFRAAIGDADPPSGSGPDRSDWVVWYARATARELGPPAGALDAEAQRRLLEAVVAAEIDPQIAYHRANRDALSALDHRLHHLGLGAFFLSAGMLALTMMIYLVTPGLSPFFSAPAGDPGPVVHAFHAFGPWSTYLDALLPALGAALSGIRSTGEFEVFAERSGETAEALTRCRAACLAAAVAPKLERTQEALAAVAEVLSDDIGQWRALYRRKQLVLPA